ncbi:DUF192 domain-containing protein [Epibacterium sp. DP7N7-1]|nr:DUF192 domain-containing protein [Epibacterium sp. DP7N7-1]
MMMAMSGAYLAVEYLIPRSPESNETVEETCRLARVTAPDGAVIKAKVAVTRSEREKGLMGREDLGVEEGMLFVYDPPKEVTMWMKDTPLPLDMFFIGDRDIVVAGIERETVPFTTEKISSPGRIGAVLETRAGAWPDLELGDRLDIECME